MKMTAHTKRVYEHSLYGYFLFGEFLASVQNNSKEVRTTCVRYVKNNPYMVQYFTESRDTT